MRPATIALMTNQEILRQLFDWYIKDSNEVHDITEFATAGGRDPLAVASELHAKGFVKDEPIVAEGKVKVAISIVGIAQVNPAFLQERITRILAPTGGAGTIWNVVDILGGGREVYQQAFDIANEMQNRDLVKLLYAFYPTKVMVEMTLKGVDARIWKRAD